MSRDTAHESGTLRFDGRLITYESRHLGSFSLPMADVAVIGEYTTQDGPFFDDWFLVFVRRDGEWFEASMYGEGPEEVRDGLSKSLRAEIHLGLAASTDFASRVLWPPGLLGQPLFEFVKPSGSRFLERMRLVILPAVRRQLSPEVLAALGGDECP